MIQSGSARKQAPVIVAVGSGLAGTGKTWIATRLASGLAGTGQRVLLVDAGRGPDRASLRLGCQAEHGLAAVVAGRVTLREAVIPVADTPGAGGFDLICAPPGNGPAQSVAAGITALGLDYDRVVLDLADDEDGTGLRLAACADALLAVANNTPDCLKATYAFIKLLRTRRPDCPVAVVANRVADATEAAQVHGALARACKTWLGFEPMAAGPVMQSGSVAGLYDVDSLFSGDPAPA